METMQNVISRTSPGLYQYPLESFLQRREAMSLEVERELATLKEWGKVQKGFLDCLFQATENKPWRDRIEDGIYQCTCGQACIWWEPLPRACMGEGGHFVEIRHQHIRYGMLQLKSGYLVSHLAPNIHQMLGHLCALVIHLAEHQMLVEALLKPLEPFSGYESLTSREKEVLECMALGENESAIAERLSIALTTVRTHRHSIYNRLEVHTPQEAILRSFALRLLEWLDLSEKASSGK